jgi:glucosylceramidase
MINDFNQGTVGWTDWNILLDQTGGPNHVGNLCFAPIHGDLDKGELIYTPSYYYIGHFSKFIRPEARRVSCSSSISYLLSTAFLNMDNSLVIVVMNEHNENINYKIVIGPNTLNLSIPRHAMQSIVIK